ncbi:DNA replication/repair protein RecF [Fulvimarina endophytica]|uniref:DNA replication and repair protein RecF n=1 Tax=Fulvimarina endophytica TaxID=2293836 RepID=A0A371WZQ9_9HYPH|nr:DNA replication/repair protein RecF [Fulvimarina endophytica]RFC62445.1 DNA replication/repair protein RecF [Fulvimarina endophytica]
MSSIGDLSAGRLSRVSALKLYDFRNYGSLDLRFDKRFVVFAGPNGAGKTNLLEALSLLSPGRGMRRASYGEMMRQAGANAFSVRADLTLGDDMTSVLTGVKGEEDRPASRQVRIGETVVKSSDELLDLSRIVWLTPGMDGLFTGPAGDRRRFLDRMVLSIDPAHGRRAGDFERAMRSRNKLLSDNRNDDVWLSGIETQMAELAVAMVFARDQLVGHLERAIAMADIASPFPKAGLDLDHGLETSDLSAPAVEIEDRYRERLARNRMRDAYAGRTLEGPHRADLSVTHLAKAMPAGLSSTGEQKALLVGLIIAHARITSALSGMTPILLLDEIAAHLDAGRRASLFDLVAELGGQTFMTGTDASLFEALGERAQMVTITDGAARTGP